MSVLGWLLSSRSARFEVVGIPHAARLSALHAAAFAKPWDVHEFERLLGERAIAADGLFIGRANHPSGFILSRMILDEAEILTVTIGLSARGRGHARPLLLHHFAALERRGLRRVHLEVEEGNVPALALYRRLGFQQIGRRAGYYLKPDGTRVAALTMSLAL